MDIMLALVISISNILCFVVGAKVGQKVNKDETLELPKVNPIEIIREKQDKREAKKEQERIDTIMRNIEMYDGTSNGQEDVPKR